MATLKEMRDKAILTQEELAQAVGVSKMTIYSWERGETSPRPAHIRKLAEVLGRTPTEVREASLQAQSLYRLRKPDKTPETIRDVVLAY